VPRLDPAGRGIHLVWSWPYLLPLSHGGYDLQRLEQIEERWTSRCELIDQALMRVLSVRPEQQAPLGPLRMQLGAEFEPIWDPKGFSPAPVPRSAGHVGDGKAGVAVALQQNAVATSAMAAATGFVVFIQELTQVVERVTVEVVGKLAITIGLSGGKTVGVDIGHGMPAKMELRAPVIDTVLVYTLSPETVRICAYDRPSAKGQPDPWAHAPYIVKGLTLPIHQADPTLTTSSQEYAAAIFRVLPGETLSKVDFDRLAATLRAPTAASSLGRSGGRTVLVRSDPTQSYEELSFNSQLSTLAVHPMARRVLGFGYADRHVIPGRTYIYRLTGRFEAADLSDAIYDVHDVPSTTVLPAAFSIRDVTFRFQTPVKVVLNPVPPSAALHAVSRHGIRVDTSGYDSSYVLPSLASWSASIILPKPVTRLVLEVAVGHSFKYAVGMPWAFGSPLATILPPGPTVTLTFPIPIMELRLVGVGTLYALRIPSGAAGVGPVFADSAPIVFQAQPLPAPPLTLAASGLQQPPTTLTGLIDESTPVPPRSLPGFDLRWLPASTSGLTVWPKDLDAGPPLDAIGYQIEHRDVTLPATYGAWEPISGGDNLTLGSRSAVNETLGLEYGTDLGAVFPATRKKPATGSYLLHHSDIFGQTDPSTGVTRPPAALGSSHQYQIRAMDAVGRVSSTTTLSAVVRLEKHIPPPLPTGPQPSPSLDASGHLTSPPGPRARAIVKGAPGLTAADTALLGTHQNAILLEWGWRQAERDLDPTTAEFRVYSTAPSDVVNATIASVTSSAGTWRLVMTTDQALVTDELVGQWISSGGYPYQVSHNGAGTNPLVTVAVSKLQPTRAPVPGPVTFGRPLRPEHQRPTGWSQRVAVYPLTVGDTYSHVFHDVLNLSLAHPRDGIWVGVSAADAEPYVADELTSGLNSNRPGNESAIVTSAVAARFQGQPIFTPPPPIEDVPEQVTDEPTGRQVLASIDVDALLAGALPAGSPIALERCSIDDVISRTSLSGTDVVLTLPDGTQETIPFPNSADHAAVVASLNSDNPERLVNKYVLHLVAASTNPNSFFSRISVDLDKVGAVKDRLPPKPGRYLYLVRAADALGHISDGGAILPIAVRVPSMALAVTPQRRGLTSTDTSVTLAVAFRDDPDTTTALLFAFFDPAHTSPITQAEAELLRIPNRRDLYPNDGLRLRLSDGTLLAPKLVKSLADVDVVIEADGTRVANLSVTATKDSWATLWCFGLSRDGIPSYVDGPIGIGVRS
jgi:hypothetical protein